MSEFKNRWWTKVFSFCLLTLITMAIGIGLLGIREARTTTGINLSLPGAAIYPQSVDQEVPEMYGDKVVWMQQGNDYYYKVFLGDLATGKTKQIGNSNAAEKYPAIWENKVIWMDYRSIMNDPAVENKYAYIFKYYDMYGYDIEKNEEFPICTNPEWQGYGDIYQNRVVYADLRTGSPDIILCDLSTKKEYAICMDPTWQGNPVIYGQYVIWMDQRSGNYDIYGFDLTTGQEFPICKAADNQAYPAIYGTKVVWQDKRNGNDDIYMYDLLTKQETAICTLEGKQQVPDIFGNIIVWQDDRSGNWDIYGYNLATGQEFQITDQSADQTFPAIFEDRLLWIDSQSGHKNVYTATLPEDFYNIYSSSMNRTFDSTAVDSSSESLTDNDHADTFMITDMVESIASINYCPLSDIDRTVNKYCCPVALNNIDAQVQQWCCPVATETGVQLLCRPCPYALETIKGEVNRCCPLASSEVAGTTMVCRPCPYAEQVGDQVVMRCCPIARDEVANERLWCYPCPIAAGVEANVRQWCCPLAEITIQGEKLWCRPCPVAKELEGGQIRWCCPVATTAVDSDLLWCRPCPYAVQTDQTDQSLELRCCPLAEIDAAGNPLYCRPCPYPQNTDSTLTPYCCPVAVDTNIEQWCRPCPYAKGVDSYLARLCCPIPLTDVDNSLLWCRPCPYAQEVDNTVIRFCCPVAQVTAAEANLICRPCPYEILENGTYKPCCPVALVTIDSRIPLCRPSACPIPCPVPVNIDPAQRCRPCRHYDDMEQDIWSFHHQAGSSMAQIGYSTDEYLSPHRSIRAKVADGVAPDDNASVSAERSFTLYECKDVNFKLSYLIRRLTSIVTSPGLPSDGGMHCRADVIVAAFDSAGNGLGKHRYRLVATDLHENAQVYANEGGFASSWCHELNNPDLTYIIPPNNNFDPAIPETELIPPLQVWHEFHRVLDQDIPIDWCQVRTLKVILAVEGKYLAKDALEIFFDDLLIWARGCEPMNWCCPIACPISVNTDPVQRCCPCKHYDDMERNTWQFTSQPEPGTDAANYVISKIGYTSIEYKSPQRSIHSYLAGTEKNVNSGKVGYTRAEREFPMCGCRDVHFKLLSLIRMENFSRSTCYRINVEVQAYDAAGSLIGNHLYVLGQYPADSTDNPSTAVGFVANKWSQLERNLSKDIPIDWCQVSKVRVLLTSILAPLRNEVLQVFWDDLFIWGSPCEIITPCCPVACPLAVNVYPPQRCVPCKHYDNMESDTWDFNKEIIPLVIANIDYSEEKCVSSERSIGAYLASFLELRLNNNLDLSTIATAAYTDPANQGYAKVLAKRSFDLYWCNDVHMRLFYFISQYMTYRNAYRKAYVRVIAYNSTGQAMDQHTYLLKQNPPEELIPEITYIGYTPDQWNELNRNLSVDMPIDWCQVKKVEVYLVAEGKFIPGLSDYLKVFWDDLAIWGQECDVINWCHPCPVSANDPTRLCCPIAIDNLDSQIQQRCCPLATDNIDTQVQFRCCPVASNTDLQQWCHPCPIAIELKDGTPLRCCPVASTQVAGLPMLCRPCPYAERVDDKLVLRCCPLAQVDVTNAPLYCYPCPLAENVDANIRNWCCPVAETKIQGQRMWCRPCPIAKELDNGVIRWCCPLADAPVTGDRMWCHPCPYALEMNGILKLHCCPLAEAEAAGSNLYCRPCPYPTAVDRELTAYCCPIALRTGQDLLCSPCPVEQLGDDYLSRLCCPVALTHVDSDVLWCRPCPYAQEVDNRIIQYCCPIAQTMAASEALWCYPCPYEILSDNGTVRRCCPVSSVQVSNHNLYCQPCPLASSAPSRVCCPVPIDPIPENCIIGKILERSSLSIKIGDGQGNIHEFHSPVVDGDWAVDSFFDVFTEISVDNEGDQVIICFGTSENGETIPVSVELYTPQSEVVSPAQLCCPISSTDPANICNPCPVPVETLPEDCWLGRLRKIEPHTSTGSAAIEIVDSEGNIHAFNVPITQVAGLVIGDSVKVCVEKDENGRIISITVELYDPQSAIIAPAQPCCPISATDPQRICRPCPIPDISPTQLCKPCPYAVQLDKDQVLRCCPLADTANIQLWCHPCPVAEVDETGKVNLRCCPISSTAVNNELMWCRPCPIAMLDNGREMWCCPLPDITVDGQRLWCRPCPMATQVDPLVRQWCCPISTQPVDGQVQWCSPCPYVKEVDGALIRYCCPVAQLPSEPYTTLWCRPCPYPIRLDAGITPICCPLATSVGPELRCIPCPLALGVDDPIKKLCCPISTAAIDSEMLWCRPCPYARQVDNHLINFCCPIASTTAAGEALWCKPCPYAVQMPDGIIKRCCPVSPITVDGRILICQPCPIAQNAPQKICCPVPIAPLPDNCFVGKIVSIMHDVAAGRTDLKVEDGDGDIHYLRVAMTQAEGLVVGDQVKVCVEYDREGQAIVTIEKYDPQSQILPPAQVCCPYPSTYPTSICQPCPISDNLPHLICQPCPFALQLDKDQVLRCCPLADTPGLELWCRPCPVAKVDVTGQMALRCCPIASATVGGVSLWCRPCPMASVDQQLMMWCCPVPDATVEGLDGLRLWCRPCPMATQVDAHIRHWCCPVSTEQAADQVMWCKPCPYVEEVDGRLTKYCCPVATGVELEKWCTPCPYAKGDDLLAKICCPVPTTQIDNAQLWCRPCPFAVPAEGGLIHYCCPIPQLADEALTLWCRPCPVASTQPQSVCCPIPTVSAAGYHLWCCPIAATVPLNLCAPIPIDPSEGEVVIHYPYYYEPYELQKFCYPDHDRDGYGDSNQVTLGPSCPDGYVEIGGDCDDNDPTVYPAGHEFYDGKDNDCDGRVDNGLTLPRNLERITDSIKVSRGTPVAEGDTISIPVTLTNVSDQDFYPPIIAVVYTKVPVLNPDGTWIDGMPYFDYTRQLPNLIFSHNSSTKPKTWKFQATSLENLTMKIELFARVGEGWLPIGRNLQEKPIGFITNTCAIRNYNFRAVSGGLQLRPELGEGKRYHRLSLPQGRLFGEVGQPGLPGFTKLVAVPIGAEMKVMVNEGTAQVFDGCLIYPNQPQPEDNQEFQTPPFTIDQQFYAKDSLYPASLASVEYDYLRGMKLALIHVHTARYNPAKKQLYYYPDLEIDIQFETTDDSDDDIIFLTPEKHSRFFEEVYANTIDNYSLQKMDLSEIVVVGQYFKVVDLLIITPSDFLTQAEDLADWKRDKGYATRVVTLDDIEEAQGGTTAVNIRAYIKSFFDNNNLSYVLLIGDAEFIPPHYVTPHPTGHGGTLMGTDLYYAEMDYSGYFPDLGVGRLPVNNTTEAQTVVDKIISYEQNPPYNQAFYERILCAAYFQDDDNNGTADREFAQTIEFLRDFYESEGFNHLPQQYTTNSGDPRWWRNGTAIPAELRKPGFPWDGDTNGIVGDINDGSLLVLHRDHGSRSGWSHPGFYTDDLDDLDNGSLLPVVMSINCQTGWFDNETDDGTLGTAANDESFAEGFLTMSDGGAVGLIAATRNSPSYPNNDLTKAFLDCMWGDLLSSYPTAADTEAQSLSGSARLADALNYAKFYVATLYSGASECQRPFEIYHVLGDPTMELWTSDPHPRYFIFREPKFISKWTYLVPVGEDDVVVSLIQDDTIIAQAVSRGGEALLQLQEPIEDTDKVILSLSKDGYVPLTQDFIPEMVSLCHDNSQCWPGQYCDKAVDNCDGFGVCSNRPIICPLYYNPVCGCDGQTYANECEASRNGVNVWHNGPCLVANCTENGDCGTSQFCEKATGDCTGQGMCQDRPQVCPDVWLPVCGCDGVTYGNECEAKMQGVNITHTGSCEVGPTSCSANGDCDQDQFCEKVVGDCDGQGQCEDRPQACIDLWRPVCGCDGNTYSNSCYAAMNGVSVKHEGVCQEACLDNGDCGTSQFCEKAVGDCEGQGQCEDRPQVCLDVWMPVCGCDGRTYGNNCVAKSNGVNVLHDGPCAEVCDGLDNDGDGVVDNGFNLQTDPQNCGSCGHVCSSYPQATAICQNGACSMGDCQEGYHDLDGDPANGCEYACTVSSTLPVCQQIDHDCDGDLDYVEPWTPVDILQYSMVMYGTAYDYNISAQEGDWIGAFGPGGESDCRGVCTIGANGSYYITIVGNIPNEVISFRLLRCADGEILDGRQTVILIHDETQIDFELVFGVCTQQIQLRAGWNWVSFNVLPDDVSFEAFFGENIGFVDQVKTQARSATNVPELGWMSDDKDSLGRIMIMGRIADGVMFKIKANTDFTLTVRGACLEPDMPIDLGRGWNWIAYLPTDCGEVESAMESIIGNLYQVKSQTKSKTKINGTLMGDPMQMCPGKGYAMKMDAAGILTYPNP